MMGSCLTIQDLDFSYAKTRILHDINCTMPDKAITSVIGASGSGKSTLLRCINRIFELHSKHHIKGKILFHGQNLLDKALDVNMLRGRIGMVFQKPTPFPMSIYENIAFALRLHEKLSRSRLNERVEEALKKAALWNEVKGSLDKAGTYLSGGQQQRLCIARTISLKPDILLFDEPTSALDPISSSKIEDLIFDLKNDFTIVMVTHNLRQARRLSDQVIFMDNGRIVESADKANFFDSPKQQLTKEYLAHQDKDC